MNLQKNKEKLLQSRLFKDSFWALFGNAIGKLLILITGVIIANYLGSNEYGQYEMVKSTLLYLSIFSTFGLGITGTSYVAKYKGSNPKRLNDVFYNITKITIYTSGIISIAIFVFANQVANYLGLASLAIILRISAIAVIFNALNNSQIGLLGGMGNFKIVSTNNIITGIFSFVISVFLCYSVGLKGAVIALCITYVFNYLVNERSLKKIKENYPKPQNDKVMRNEMIKFSLPIALQEALQSFCGWITIAILVKMTDYTQLGIFSASSTWIAAISFVPSVLKNVTLSHLSNSRSNHRTIVNKMLLVNFIATISMFLVIFLFSGLIAKGYGNSFSGIDTVLNIMVFSSVIGCMGSVFVQELISISKNWLSLYISLLKNFIVIVIGTTLIINTPIIGSMAFAISTLSANIIYLVCLFFSYKYYTSK